MKKRQDKKPDFLRDINTGIMEDLTVGGIKDNAAGLAGELKEVEEVTELCGLRFNGYLAKRRGYSSLYRGSIKQRKDRGRAAY